MAIACPDCGTIEELPPLPRRGTAVCGRCDADLEKRTGRTIDAALACSAATFLLLFPANILPLIRVRLFGLHGENVTATGIEMLLTHGWVFLAGVSAVLVIVLPFVRFGLLTAVLGSTADTRRGRRRLRAVPTVPDPHPGRGACSNVARWAARVAAPAAARRPRPSWHGIRSLVGKRRKEVRYAQSG